MSHCVERASPLPDASRRTTLADGKETFHFPPSIITVTRNEILYSLNKPDDFILAMVEFLPDDSHRVHYLRQPFRREPDFDVTSVNYTFGDLLTRAEAPR